MSTGRVVDLIDGSTIDVGAGEWEHVAVARHTLADSERTEVRLVLMRHTLDQRALIYVTRESTKQRFGEIVTPQTDPIRAMLRCAKRSGVEPVNKQWYGLVDGFS